MLDIFSYLAAFYGLSELLLSIVKRSDKNSSWKRKDRGSMAAIWLVMFTCLTAAFFYAGKSYTFNIFSLVTGLLVYLTGMVVRWTSIFQLRKAFTVDVAVSEGQRLKTNGLYRLVRHPSYLGILLIIAGLGTGMNNIVSLLIVFVPVFLAINYRIDVEEKLLIEFFGDEYVKYSLSTKKIIPWVY
ncbi:MAG TPA: isoprenylcysteine carboxylmethyltransferase family protein [Bacteroidales bacterium]|nr:isoprenylcysteine carboxylmethyltransferase family protein [Bacteroidales bacterium]